MAWLRRWQAIPSWQRVLGGFALGALAGVLLGPVAAAWLGPLGTLYIALVAMAVLPLVLFAAMRAVPALRAQCSGLPQAGPTLAWCAVTAVLAVGVALAVAHCLQPGAGAGVPMPPRGSGGPAPVTGMGPVQILLDLVPANPFAALAQGRWLQVLLFAGLVGFALSKLGERSQGVQAVVVQLNEAMIQVLRWVLALTPLGVFGLVAAWVGQHGLQVLLPLLYFAFALYLACALHIVVVYAGLLLAHGLNPLRFFQGAARAMKVAFVSSSSAAALPVSLHSAEYRLGVDRDYAGLALPLGAGIKMDGCSAIYPVLAAVFAAQFYGIELGWVHYVAILLASVLGGFGMVGVPATSTLMLILVLGAAGLPLQVLGLLLVIDRWLDMMRTMTNVTGQLLVPVLVARERGLLDRAVYGQAAAAGECVPGTAPARGDDE